MRKESALMKILKNIDHSFDVAVNDVGCTIRKGVKWTVPLGTELLLMNCSEGHKGSCGKNCTCEGTGKVIGYWYGDLDDLPPHLLAIEHNYKLRDMGELFKMLRHAYPLISMTDTVTALVYLRTEKPE